MLQFYFLSIVLNALAGLSLVSKDEDEIPGVKLSFKNENYKLWLGILTAVLGVLKILSSVEGDVPVVGDLVPALAGILAGLALIIEHQQRKSADFTSFSSFSSQEEDGDTLKKFSLLTANKKIIGIIALIAAALHFLFPKVLLL